MNRKNKLIILKKKQGTMPPVFIMPLKLLNNFNPKISFYRSAWCKIEFDTVISAGFHLITGYIWRYCENIITKIHR